MGYYIDDIINSEYTKIKMVFNDDEDKENTLITGFMTDDTFDLGGNASWGELADEELAGVSGLTNAGQAIGKLIEGLGGKALSMLGHSISPSSLGAGIGTGIGAVGRLAGFGGKLIQQTVAKWEGTEKPTFDVGLLFIRTASNENKPEHNARYIIARCYPHFYGVVMRSPMGYIPMAQLADFSDNKEGRYTTGDASKHTGTCTLAIGKWFMASNLLIQSANFSFSKECTNDGSPLYASGKVQFISARAVSYNEYQSWFINDNGQPNAGGVFNDILKNANGKETILSTILHKSSNAINNLVNGIGKGLRGEYGEGADAEEPPMP